MEVTRTDQRTAGSPQADAPQWLADHGDYLFGFAVSRVGDVPAAEDLVQETLLAAMKSHVEFAGRSTVRTWLTGILKHKIADHLRRESRSRALPRDEFQSSEDTLQQWVEAQFTKSGKWKQPPARWDDPSTELERRELGKVLWECLEKLPARAAEIFMRNEGGDTSAENLSKTFDLSTTNIGVILHRARLALRRCLEINWFKVKSGRTS